MNLDDVSLRPLKPIDMGGLSKILGVVDPTLAQDAATKNYVDTRTINTLAS